MNRNKIVGTNTWAITRKSIISGRPVWIPGHKNKAQYSPGRPYRSYKEAKTYIVCVEQDFTIGDLLLNKIEWPHQPEWKSRKALVLKKFN